MPSHIRILVEMIFTAAIFFQLRNKIESQRDESERSIYEDEESRVGGEWGPLPDVMRNAYYFEQISAGLQSQEFFRVSLALADIVEQYSVQKIRFWGKIIGTRSNYYIAEADFLEGESENEESDDETEEENDDGTPSDDDTVGSKEEQTNGPSNDDGQEKAAEVSCGNSSICT